ncbi:uncharacterized protein LOC110096054 [Dendrobium catenatum]|uniref:uncharacterized protein LOC110096054 n=1 Tax=Dendrobium catenatum TaxID=906689 RepID=UPI0009F34E2B|nr:uncharacterized protein LOC110096054 [Dendrobium catenatum]
MELYVDEKWKLSKKESRNSASRREVATGGDSAYLKRSSSLPAVRASGGGNGARSRSFTGRCAHLVKEQRARFYIMRRCVTMLICWRDYS